MWPQWSGGKQRQLQAGPQRSDGLGGVNARIGKSAVLDLSSFVRCRTIAARLCGWMSRTIAAQAMKHRESDHCGQAN